MHINIVINEDSAPAVPCDAYDDVTTDEYTHYACYAFPDGGAA